MEGLIFRILRYFRQLSLNTIITVGNQRSPQYILISALLILISARSVCNQYQVGLPLRIN